MAINYTTAVKNARLNAVTTAIGATGVLEIGSAAMASVLATIPLATPAAPGAAAAVLTFTMPQSDATADNTGTAAGGAVSGTMAATESGNDTAAASGDVFVKGNLAVSESGSDTFAASCDLFVKGNLAVSESGSDFFSGSGALSQQTKDTHDGGGWRPEKKPQEIKKRDVQLKKRIVEAYEEITGEKPEKQEIVAITNELIEKIDDLDYIKLSKWLDDQEKVVKRIIEDRIEQDDEEAIFLLL